MPKSFDANGFRFMIYLNDHEPPHVHVVRGRSEAKIFIEDAQLDWAKEMTNWEVTKARATVKQRQEKLLSDWRRIHGKGD